MWTATQISIDKAWTQNGSCLFIFFAGTENKIIIILRQKRKGDHEIDAQKKIDIHSE